MKKFRLNRRKKIAVFVAFLLVAGSVVFWLTRGGTELAQDTKQEQKFYSQLTGVEVSKEDSELPILGVMIENSEEARPQSGLDAAGIVFETVTEGGITRYLALYQENKPQEVGPVRSVRPAFVDWGMGFDASFAHVGGSATALQMLDDRRAKSMNEFINANAYYRRDDRAAPHDAYARTTDLVALQREKGHGTSNVTGFPRSDDAPAPEPTARVITLRFSHPLYHASFTYDSKTNGYARVLAGQAHVDEATGQQITTRNLITIEADIQAGGLGSGKATLYKDGTAHDLNWEQDSFGNRIRFTDENGNEIGLNRGDLWIAVVPINGSISVQ